MESVWLAIGSAVEFPPISSGLMGSESRKRRPCVVAATALTCGERAEDGHGTEVFCSARAGSSGERQIKQSGTKCSGPKQGLQTPIEKSHNKEKQGHLPNPAQLCRPALVLY